MTSIAANITKHREQLGIAQAELARLVGVSPATMSRWESGASGPSRNNLKLLAAALQTTPASIHGEPGSASEIDVTILARGLETLEAILGKHFACLTASQRAKLLAFVYTRGGEVSASEARALLALVA